MPDPANFQFPAGIVTTVQANAPARLDPYTLPGTLRNVQQPSGAARDNATPLKSGDVVGLGNVRRFYANDQASETATD